MAVSCISLEPAHGVLGRSGEEPVDDRLAVAGQLTGDLARGSSPRGRRRARR